MESEAYRRLQVAWVSSNTGSGMEEPFLAILPMALMIFISSVIQKNLFILDFILLVIPAILSFTAFSSELHRLPLYLSIVSAIYCICKRKSTPLGFILSNHSELMSPWITNLRACTHLATVICIFAVDLNIFPRKFAKTEVSGFGAMDLGVGFYVICSGLVQKTRSIKHEMNDVKLLCGLGAIRFLCIRLVAYQEHVTEYGVHWNFFFTLTACRFVTIILNHIFKLNFFWASIICAIAHQSALSGGAQDWVLSSRGRDNFLDANREGISSILGYATLFSCSVMFKNNILGNSMKRQVLKTLALVVIAWAETKACAVDFGVSRRLCNTGYIVWSIANAASLALVLMIIDIALLWTGNPRTPPLMATINRHGLFLFLVGNVLTGIINLNVQTLLLSTFYSYFILIFYVFLTLSLLNLRQKYNKNL